MNKNILLVIIVIIIAILIVIKLRQNDKKKIDKMSIDRENDRIAAYELADAPLMR